MLPRETWEGGRGGGRGGGREGGRERGREGGGEGGGRKGGSGEGVRGRNDCSTLHMSVLEKATTCTGQLVFCFRAASGGTQTTPCTHNSTDIVSQSASS